MSRPLGAAERLGAGEPKSSSSGSNGLSAPVGAVRAGDRGGLRKASAELEPGRALAEALRGTRLTDSGDCGMRWSALALAARGAGRLALALADLAAGRNNSWSSTSGP